MTCFQRELLPSAGTAHTIAFALRTYVRTRPQYELNATQRNALKLLSEHREASVAHSATGVVDGKPVIHAETAFVLIRQGYAEGCDGGIAITEAGLRKSGKIHESASERRRRKTAEALEAQASGKWVPAPAGASAEASSDEAWARQERADAQAELTAAHDAVRFERQMLAFAKSWDLEEDLTRHRRDLERAEAELAEAKAEVDRLRQAQQRHA